MSILNIFSNDDAKTFAGLRINKNGFLEVLELQKVNNSYNPVFWTKESFDTFIKKDGVLDKKKFIDFFKIIRTKTKSSNFKVCFQEFETKDDHFKIVINESLKIAGFGPKNKEIEKPNTKGIILSNNLTENENVLYFHKNNIVFLETQKGKVKNKKEFNILDLDAKKVLELLKNLESKKIKMVGSWGELFRTTKNLLKACGAEVEEVNIWQNILSFSDAIPDISKEESQYVVEILALTVPKLRKWEYLPIKVEKEKIESKDKKLENKVEKKKEKKEEKKKMFLPKTKKKKTFLPKNKKSLLPKEEKAKSLPKNKKKEKKEDKEKEKKAEKKKHKKEKPKKDKKKTEPKKEEKKTKKIDKKEEKVFLKKWKEKTEEEIKKELQKNLEVYADKDILFEQKTEEDKIAEYSDFKIKQKENQNSFWQKIKNFFGQKIL